ncbi:MAG: VanW family protein [Actinomycetota bacterium]
MVNLPRPHTRTQWVLVGFAGAVGALVTLLALVSFAEHRIWAGKVLPGIEVADTDVGGLSEADLRAAVDGIAKELQTTLIKGRTADRVLTLDPRILGLTVDREATIRAVTGAGRDDNPLASGLGTVLRWFRPDRVRPVVAYDRASLEGVLDGWTRGLRSGLVEGGLRFEGAEVVTIDPRPGDGLDREQARTRVETALLSTGAAREFALPVGPVDPAVGAEAVAAAAARARRLLVGPVEIVANGKRVRIEPETLGEMLSARPDGERLALVIDPQALRSAITPLLAGFETQPRAAGFSVNPDGSVTVVPSQDGTVVDLGLTANRILAGERIARLAVRRVHPERDTEWARRLGITRQVSSFTTNFTPGQPRVINIQTAARALDGAVVPPGATFSLNEHVGPRTPDKGYVKAPILVNDGYGEDYGGGVSQIATTLFNAVFFGGYVDVEHAAHRFYISRYPMGREATINYPSIDVKFRNNTKYGVLIRAWYTDSSITIAFFGNNEGRVVREEDREIVQETAPSDELIECPVEDPEDDPDGLCAGLAAGERVLVRDGITGYDVRFARVIEQPGKPTRREQYSVRYPMLPVRYLVGTTPATTTTTTPRPGPSTTTTTKPSTTTTPTTVGG